MKKGTPHKIYGDEFNPLDYWAVLARHKRLIGLIVGAAFVISVAVSLLLPNIYSSTASILPPQQDNSLSPGIMSRLPDGMGGIVSGFLGIESPAELWVGILKSRTVKDAVIAKLNLKELYKAKTIEDARRDLDKRLSIMKSKEGIISITVEDKDPEMVPRITNAFVEELDMVNKGVVMTSGKRMRVFIEERLNEVKKELAKGEEAIKAFQEKNRAVRLDVQSEAIIEAIGSMKGLLMAKEVELKTLLSYATANHPHVEILKAEVAGLEGRLKELEEGKKENINPHQKDIFIPTVRMPAISLQYARLLRDVKVQETLYELLTQQYEMARIQEAMDSPTVQVLDAARVPDRKSKPRRALIVELATFAAVFFAVFMAFFLEYIQDLRAREAWKKEKNKAETGQKRISGV